MRAAITAAMLICGVCSAAPAVAEQVPPYGDFDARVRSVSYNPGQVYRLNMAMRSALEITFGENETVENIAVGDAVSWEIAPSGNLLFVKPRDKAAPTNLIATTKDARGRSRSYHFELTTDADSTAQRSGAVFAVRFIYPADVMEQRHAQADAKLRFTALAIEAQAVSLSLDAAVTQGERNLAYSLAGPEVIAPSEVSDNGVSTVLRFPRGKAVPAIYKVLPDGTEAMVNFDVRGEFVVIHEVTNQLRLRMGQSLVCIWNDRPLPPTGDLSSGTVSPSVVRETETQ